MSFDVIDVRYDYINPLHSHNLRTHGVKQGTITLTLCTLTTCRHMGLNRVRLH